MSNEALYRYYCINRPPHYAAVPLGWSASEIWYPAREESLVDTWNGEPSSERYMGWVDYPQRLSMNRVWRFELRPENSLEYIASRIVNRCGGRCDEPRIAEEIDAILSYLHPSIAPETLVEEARHGEDAALAVWLRRIFPDSSAGAIGEKIREMLV